MIHWAWLILAFIAGLFLAWAYWVIIDWRARIKASWDIKPVIPLPPHVHECGCYVAHPNLQPPDNTKPDLKRPPSFKCFHCGCGILGKAMGIPPGDTYNHWRLLCPACFERQPIDDTKPDLKRPPDLPTITVSQATKMLMDEPHRGTLDILAGYYIQPVDDGPAVDKGITGVG